jgi:hypothetical protein
MPQATTKLQRNVDRLIRSLVGVIDYALVWGDSRCIERIDILKDSGVEEYQLVRNVVSGLGAGCGVRLHRPTVRVHTDAAEFAVIREAAATAAAEHVAPEPMAGGALRSGVVSAEQPALRNGAPAGTDNGARAAVPTVSVDRIRRAPEPVEEPDVLRLPVPVRPLIGSAPPEPASSGPGVLTLNRIELEPRGATLRCRVILGLGDRIYSAIAEVPATPTAEAEVAARVTLDALRAGELAGARLEGVGFSTIAETTFVLASVRDIGGVMPRAGAVALQDSMAHAACNAVLAAVGPITTENLIAAEQRLDSMLSS